MKTETKVIEDSTEDYYKVLFFKDIESGNVLIRTEDDEYIVICSKDNVYIGTSYGAFDNGLVPFYGTVEITVSK